MTSLEEWARIEADAWTRSQADDDEHVRQRETFLHACTVQMCLLFCDLAKAECDSAMNGLEMARARCERATVYLNRTTATLEQAVKLQALAMRRR